MASIFLLGDPLAVGLTLFQVLSLSPAEQTYGNTNGHVYNPVQKIVP